MTLQYTPEALASLKGIYAYYRIHSRRAAAVIHNDILDRIDRLVDSPQMAPLEPSLTESPFEYAPCWCDARGKSFTASRNTSSTLSTYGIVGRIPRR